MLIFLSHNPVGMQAELDQATLFHYPYKAAMYCCFILLEIYCTAQTGTPNCWATSLYFHGVVYVWFKALRSEAQKQGRVQLEMSEFLPASLAVFPFATHIILLKGLW